MASCGLRYAALIDREWIRPRKLGFETTNPSRSETMRVLFVHILLQFRGLKLEHVCSVGSGSTPC
jgi:hypothetical protein